MTPGGLMAPRPMPHTLLPALLGSVVVVVACPVFVLAHWPLGAWGLAAGLWVAGQALMVVIRRLRLGIDSLAASGAAAFGRMIRAVGVMVILIVVTVSDSHLGIYAVGVYVLAYTVEFGSSVITYFAGEARG